MSYYKKQQAIKNLEQQAEEYENPETDPRIPHEENIEALNEMDEDELMERFSEDDDCGLAVQDKVLEDLKAASAPQEEIQRVQDMNPYEVLSEFGEANAETIRDTAISIEEKQIEDCQKHYEYLLNEIEETRKTPAKYFD